jgi:hypothetical protein
VPRVIEGLTLAEQGVRLGWKIAESPADPWAVGQKWGDLVARQWEKVVAESFASSQTDA